MLRGAMLVSRRSQERQKILSYKCSGFRSQEARMLEQHKTDWELQEGERRKISEENVDLFIMEAVFYLNKEVNRTNELGKRNTCH